MYKYMTNNFYLEKKYSLYNSTKMTFSDTRMRLIIFYSFLDAESGF